MNGKKYCETGEDNAQTIGAVLLGVVAIFALVGGLWWVLDRFRPRWDELNIVLAIFGAMTIGGLALVLW